MGKKKVRCKKCGKKIGRVDRMKLKMMATSVEVSEKAKEEFKELEGWCPKCIQNYFKPKFKEAMKDLGDRVVPERFKGLLRKGKELTEK